REDKLEELIQKPEKVEKIPESALRRVPTVGPDTILEDMFSIVTENQYPVPVVDENNKFLGVVTTDQIFESITPMEGESNV
ncbi:MAG: hypothetical protein DRP58_13140, partial [Spirochaetes bacterium]